MSLRRVLVTGAAGGIGAACCDHFAQQGIQVTGLSLAGPFPASCDRAVVGDATSPAAIIDALDGVDAIVHLAAIPHPSLGTPFAVYTANVTSAFAVLSAAGEAGIQKVIMASSINATGIPFNPHQAMPAYFPIDEHLPEDLGDAYSLSKRSGELAAEMASRRWGTKIVSLRFPLVKTRAELLDTSTSYARSPEKSVREGWSYLDVRDAARALHAALMAPIEGAVVIGLSAADTLLPYPTEQALTEWAPGVPLRRSLRKFGSAVDTSRAEEILDFRPMHSIHDGGGATAAADTVATGGAVHA